MRKCQVSRTGQPLDGRLGDLFKEAEVLYKIVFGSYDVKKVKEIEGKFSEQVQEMLDQGWELRGELKTHMHILQLRSDLLEMRVTLIQEVIKEKA